MADYQLIIIGGGLSGLAAGIRAARFGKKTLILEQHGLPGGLNSFYYRQGHLLETGLHAMTNCAGPKEKHAPFNRLLRQLHLSRREFVVHEQLCSEIRFPGSSLTFSNDPELLTSEIAACFPTQIDHFCRLRADIAAYDPFATVPWSSARAFLGRYLTDPLLVDMLLLPLMVYGNAEERDMDLGQFVIMFRAVFEEGFFRPQGSIRDFLELLVTQYRQYGGELRYKAPVATLIKEGKRIVGVRLADGSEYSAEMVVSTAGLPETVRLSGWLTDSQQYSGKMSFIETISLLAPEALPEKAHGRTIIFYNTRSEFTYCRPAELIDASWGVICFPEHFADMPGETHEQIRVTNAASHPLWQQLPADGYSAAKKMASQASVAASEEIIGNYQQAIVYQDSFTPLTIERFTAKAAGAVYGSAIKIKDGTTPWENLFIAGTDQGYLGIVGAMLSGITIVNRHIL